MLKALFRQISIYSAEYNFQAIISNKMPNTDRLFWAVLSEQIEGRSDILVDIIDRNRISVEH